MYTRAERDLHQSIGVHRTEFGEDEDSEVNKEDISVREIKSCSKTGHGAAQVTLNLSHIPGCLEIHTFNVADISSVSSETKWPLQHLDWSVADIQATTTPLNSPCIAWLACVHVSFPAPPWLRHTIRLTTLIILLLAQHRIEMVERRLGAAAQRGYSKRK